VAISQADHHEDQYHQPTDLDVAQKAFMVGLGHQADLLMQLRPLDTGVAKDVSGILRVTRGPMMEEDEEEEKEVGGMRWKEMEVLYHVRGDGVVRLWERGEEVVG
jgi:elongator complex protein 6